MTPGSLHPLGRTAVSLTRLGLGGAPMGNLFRAVTDADARGAVEAAWAAGVRYFDTAPLYGHGLGERRLGAALRPHPRDAFVLSTKVGRRLVPEAPGAAPVDGGAYVEVPPYGVRFDYSHDGTLASLESSLERLGLGRVDVALIHDIGAVTHGAAHEARYREAMTGAYRALERLRSEGVIRAIGVGANEWQVCERCAGDGDFDAFLLAGRYSLLEQTALDSFLPLCARRGIGVIVGGAFNSGILASGPVPDATYDYAPAPPGILDRVRRLEAVCRSHGVPLAAAAIQFPLAHPAVSAVVVGARTAAEARANAALLAQPVPPALWRDLRAEALIRDDAPTP